MTPNNRAPFHAAVYLTGPTAVGKTEISLRLAERLGAEIIALDAMTLYRGMDIGTAKVTLSERERVPHHLLDLFDPKEESSLERYLDAASRVLNELADRQKPALFVGGSPLYSKACLRGLSDLPARDDALRANLEHEARERGVEQLHQRLAGIDPVTAGTIASTDLRRIVRALEIHELTGGLPSQMRDQHARPAPPTVPVIALLRDRKQLYARIDQRAEAMFRQGLVDEAARLPQPLSRSAAQAVGYAEAFEVLAGRMTTEAAIERTKLRTRHYAKHQLTWFRRLEEVRGLRIDDQAEDRIVDRIVEHIEACRAGERPPGDPIE